MNSIRTFFNEAAALVVGATTMVAGAKGTFAAVDLLFAAGGIPPGLVTGLAGLAMVSAGALAAGAIGYKGTMVVANELTEALGGPSSAEAPTTGPVVRTVTKVLPEVAARSYIFPYRWP